MEHSDNLTKHVMIRLTPGDAERLADQSRLLNVKPTTFARVVLLNYLRALEQHESSAGNQPPH